MPGDDSSFCRSEPAQAGQLATRSAVTNASKCRPQPRQAYSNRGMDGIVLQRVEGSPRGNAPRIKLNQAEVAGNGVREDAVETARVERVHPFEDAAEHRAVLGGDRPVAVLVQGARRNRDLLTGQPSALQRAAEPPVG